MFSEHGPHGKFYGKDNCITQNWCYRSMDACKLRNHRCMESDKLQISLMIPHHVILIQKNHHHKLLRMLLQVTLRKCQGDMY